MRKSHFEGRYYKQRGADGTVAFIVARHTDESGTASASLQLIADEGTWNVRYPASAMQMDGSHIQLGNSLFSESGICLDVRTDDLCATGALSFDCVVPPRGDIMGPFRFAPGMECRHTVASLMHRVDGTLSINAKRRVFQKGTGYIEGDRGTSFPRCYVWTHVDWDGNSLMLSVADVPFHGLSFVGCVGFLYLNGREIRIATYRGARIDDVSNDAVRIRQHDLTLTITAEAQCARGLLAPVTGKMARIIRESASCPVHCHCAIGQKTLLDFKCAHASFEGNWTFKAP